MWTRLFMQWSSKTTDVNKWDVSIFQPHLLLIIHCEPNVVTSWIKICNCPLTTSGLFCIFTGQKVQFQVLCDAKKRCFHGSFGKFTFDETEKNHPIPALKFFFFLTKPKLFRNCCIFIERIYCHNYILPNFMIMETQLVPQPWLAFKPFSKQRKNEMLKICCSEIGNWVEMIL